MGGLETDSAAPLVEPLTRREREILVYLNEGFSAPEIAEQLSLAISSVKFHVQNIYSKLGVNSKRQALTRARALGLLAAAVGAAAPGAAPTPPAAAAHSPAVRRNLPTQITQFFGREAETAQIRQSLAERRLMTLTGSGGVGKTRLAQAVAESAMAEAALGNFVVVGVWFVALAPLTDPALVTQQVATDLGLPISSERSTLETLTFALRDRQILLVLDNCEHVLAACARLADALLRACPRLRLLVTSREPLGIEGEAVFPVPPLPFPDPDHLPALETFSRYSALSLFVDRARLVRPDFQIDAHNAGAIARICWRLDGIPLALELAAARLRLLDADTLAGRLDDAFGLLTGGSRAAPPRHQTLHATIDWSYQLLSEAERRLLQRLSIFAGGCTLAAAEAVCADPRGKELAAGQVLDRLAALVDKSMVIVSQPPGEAARYHLLEMVRQFAREKLESAEGIERLSQRHYDYFLWFAETNGTQLWYKDRPVWMNKFHADYENLRLALEWAYNHSTDVEAGPRLTIALQPYWNQRDFREGTKWFGAGVDRWRNGAAMDPSLAARLLSPYAEVDVLDHDLKGRLRREGQVIARSLGPQSKEILLNCMWGMMWHAHDWEQLQALLDEAETIIQGLGPGSALDVRLYRALHGYHQGMLERARGQDKLAKTAAMESIRWFQTCCHDVNLIWPYELLGDLALRSGDYDQAYSNYAEAYRLSHENDDTRQGNDLANLCHVAVLQKDYARALDYCQTYIELAYRAETPFNVLERIETAAMIIAMNGRYHEAARLSGAAEALTEKLGRKISAENSDNEQRGDWTTRYADASLDALVPEWGSRPDGAAIVQAWNDGRALSYDAVVAEALALTAPASGAR